MTAQPPSLAQNCANWLAAGHAFALVRIAKTEGSTPRDSDAVMALTKDALIGTIGGGRLEWEAIIAARAMLDTASDNHTMVVALGPAIGQCCGGRVTLAITRGTARAVKALQSCEAKASSTRPSVMIYGSGHVGRALARALAPLPFQIKLIDSRAEELQQATSAGVELVLTQTPVTLAEQSPCGCAHVIMTHSHALDSLLAAAVLEKNAFRYLGIIGSDSKRASILNAFKALGLAQAQIDRVVCPLGDSSLRDKRPEVIAALTAAEITQALLG